MYKLIQRFLTYIFNKLDVFLHKDRTYIAVIVENSTLKLLTQGIQQLASEKEDAEKELFNFKINYVKNEIEKIIDFVTGYMRWDNAEEIYAILSMLETDKNNSSVSPPVKDDDRKKYFFNASYDVLDYLEYILKSNPRMINKIFVDRVYRTTDSIDRYIKQHETSMPNLNHSLKKIENHYCQICGGNFYKLSVKELLNITEALSRLPDDEATSISRLIGESDDSVNYDFAKGIS